MPIFDFRCRTCEHEFDALVRVQDPPPACPSCRGKDLEKLMSSFAVKSAEKTQAAALVSRKKAAKAATSERVQFEKEIDHHKHEDH